jgi:hypothetical protein
VLLLLVRVAVALFFKNFVAEVALVAGVVVRIKNVLAQIVFGF